MPKGKLVVLLVSLLFNVIILSQLGCGRVDVKAEDASRSSDSINALLIATPVGEIHDLAITAIDFDPALKPGMQLATENITLLVAVENRGNRVEQDTLVDATLLGLPDSDVLVSSQDTIKAIVPGESQVIRFSNFSSIPLRSAYSLRVEVRPVTGETNITNNTRTYRLEVTLASR